jgi:DNA invertase Pin-like site-specific DNA recombinase
VHDPNDAVGRLPFNVLAMVAESESVAKAKGRLRGKQRKLNPRQEADLGVLLESAEHSSAELADWCGLGRSTVYRAEQRHLAAIRA